MSYEPDEDHPAIVIDNGSSTCRAGFAGDDAPRSVFHSVVGRRKQQLGDEKTYIGDEAQSKRELLSLSYPMEHGIVTNWEDMEKIWNHAFFSDLKISPESHPILISEPPLNPKGNREKMAQVMFESLKTPAFFPACQPLLSLYGIFEYQGVIVSVGDGVTYAVPIYETQVQFQAARRVDFGGRDLTCHLQHLLYQGGYSFTTSSELEIVREIKEDHCFVTENTDHCGNSLSMTNLKSSHTLQDGSSINLFNERHQCPEILFQPDGIFNKGKGIAELIVDSVNDCDIHARKDMYFNVILSGGSTAFLGFAERLTKELCLLLSPGIQKVRVHAKPDRQSFVWYGSSILATLSSFQSLWITREQYEEYGPDIVNMISV